MATYVRIIIQAIHIEEDGSESVGTEERWDCDMAEITESRDLADGKIERHTLAVRGELREPQD